MKTPKLIARGIKRLLENEWEERVLTSARIIHDCGLALDAMYIVYQAGGAIVSELANRNGDRYIKDGTIMLVGARVKGDPVKNRWLDRRALSANEDIATGILKQIVYENDNSDVSCDSELSECSDNDLSGCDNIFQRYWYVILKLDYYTLYYIYYYYFSINKYDTSINIVANTLFRP